MNLMCSYYFNKVINNVNRYISSLFNKTQCPFLTLTSTKDSVLSALLPFLSTNKGFIRVYVLYMSLLKRCAHISYVMKILQIELQIRNIPAFRAVAVVNHF